MNQTIFFDNDSLRRGVSYELIAPVETSDGLVLEIDEWLGRGGNASVFSCTAPSTGENYAIKFLLTPRETSRKRFGREIRLLKQLHGDNIVKYHGCGSVRARLRRRGRSAKPINPIMFILFDLAEKNLVEAMEDHLYGLKYEEYAGQIRGLTKALANLHQLAIHRDIKPENILISGQQWMLSDYGLCSFVDPDGEELTQASHNLGPKYWLSPEAHNRRLKRGDQVTKSSDVFQLAAIFWYVATGRHPCGIVTRDDWTGPDALYGLLEKALMHDVKKRPQDGSEFLAELEDALFS